MAKQPIAGIVKTRLGKDIGTVSATNFYRVATNNLVQRLTVDSRWQTILAVSPDNAMGLPCWPYDVPQIPQGKGDLGKRMQRVFDELPPGPIIIIGTDIPEITSRTIANAFTSLQGRDAIIGPSEDGGYWLIGQSRVPRALDIFSNVRWSTALTRADTLSNLAGHRVRQLQFLNDVDDGNDYRRLKTIAGRLIPPH